MTRICSLALCLTLGLSGAAFAQNNTGSIANAQPSGNDATAHEHSGSAMKHSARHHASSKAAHHAMDRGETAYRSELRRCVEGPSNDRDRCLDQAIAHRHRG